eukprot:TRINITY_DN4963_c0_g1_i1.p1 TRINITY_DN4963_c0_g1~~TRINITY_DN4963_c0_g1_i1.p1  ORF type:complete len:997 (+),score=242.80 TRINITY_DN4963_c0_g1_i1:6-2996(+)
MEPYKLETYKSSTFDKLNNQLNTIPGHDDNSRKSYWEAVEKEIANFDDYCNTAHAVIGTKLWSLIRIFSSPTYTLQGVLTVADSLCDVIVSLNKNIGTNIKAYTELRQRFDLLGGKQPVDYFDHLMKAFTFCTLGFGDYGCMLSDIYFTVRQLQLQESGKVDEFVAGSGRVKNLKYFVRSEDVHKVKLDIVKNIPLLRKQYKQGVLLAQAKPGRRYSGFAHLNNGYENGGFGDVFLTNSVYFDNPSLKLYHDRLLKKEGAFQVRAHWTGQEGGNVTLEKKIRSFALHDSYAEDIDVAWNQVSAFISGRVTAKVMFKDQKGDIADVGANVQKAIIKNDLRPFMRVSNYRTIFQKENDSRVRVSLESGIHFIREQSDPGKDSWCRDLSKGIPLKEGFIFPFSVLSVSISSTDEPDWLTKLVNDEVLIPASSFSNFVHGIAKFDGFRTKVLPPWFNKLVIHSKGFPYKEWFRHNFTVDKDGQLMGALDDDNDGAVINNMPTTSTKINTSSPATTTSAPTTTTTTTTTTSPTSKPGDIVEDTGKDKKRQSKSSNNNNSDPSNPIWSSGANVDQQDDVEDEDVSNLGNLKRKFLTVFGPGKSDNTPLLNPVRIEPKTFFANERTLLQWLNMCVFIAIGSFAFIAVASDGHKIVGTGLLIFALVFAFYSLAVYHYRRASLVAKSVDGHYDDKWGPTFLIAALFVYLLAGLIFQLVYTPPLNNSPVTVYRDYRIKLDAASLQSASTSTLPNFLSTVQSELSSRLESSWSISTKQSLTNEIRNQSESFWDTRGSCLLKKNGYNLKQIVSNPLELLQTLSSSFTFESQDKLLITKMDETFPKAGYTAREDIRPPYIFKYSREVTLPISTAGTFQTVQDIPPYFDTFFLWDSLNSLNLAEPVELVNSIVLIHSVYGDIDVTFSSGRVAKLNAHIWSLNQQPVYGEVSLSFAILPRDDLSQDDIKYSREFFSKLQSGISQFATVTNPPVPPVNVADFVYSYQQAFCS